MTGVPAGGVEGLDHVAITVADVDVTLDWYERVLGAERLYDDLRRSGVIPVALLQLGGSRLSVHAVAAPAAPHAVRPVAGSADLCFRCRGPVESILAGLAAARVEVVEGPVDRPASNGVMGRSVYLRDPDGNLIELLTTASAPP
ncbi:VOC family protein [Rhabdothermincola salaria]|uniref:VOC family protein n=1 Tax=Rhabdothermincola salaria TaxID=2903142 RepID=UPI001E444833|nr:VOC family protein [Rhabdothermincola salaria]MCD9624341.1 VOC family protein [Rhabdothermincola salaria]